MYFAYFYADNMNVFMLMIKTSARMIGVYSYSTFSTHHVQLSRLTLCDKQAWTYHVRNNTYTLTNVSCEMSILHVSLFIGHEWKSVKHYRTRSSNEINITAAFCQCLLQQPLLAVKPFKKQLHYNNKHIWT